MTSADFFALQKNILERLFPRGWFLDAHNRRHPAFRRWDLCRAVLDQGGVIRFPEHATDLPLIGRMLLDSIVFVALTEGNVGQLRLGSLDVYGDDAVAQKLRSRIIDPGQFENLMVELAFGAWHKDQGHVVTPFEVDGWPDLRIDLPARDPLLVECKLLRSGSRNRIAKEVVTANRQIKAPGLNAYGIAVLDATAPVVAGQPLGELQQSVEAALTGSKNRSVRAAILLWDSYQQFGAPPEDTSVFFMRNHQLVQHRGCEEVKAAPPSTALFQGYTTYFRVLWAPRA